MVESFAGSLDYAPATSQASFTIAKAVPTFSFNAQGGTYNASAYSATGSVIGVGTPPENLGTPTFTYYAGPPSPADELPSAPVDAGNYTVVASFTGNGNYQPATSTPLAFQIGQANQTITWSNPPTITYGTALSTAELDASVAGIPGGAAPGALFYGTGIGTVLNAGNNQTLTVSAAATIDYTSATFSVTINVNRASLTVTTSNASRCYGDPNPTFNVSVVGVVNNDNITAVATTLATAASPVASYAITPTLSDPNNRLGNYVVTINPGSLSVTKRTLIVTASPIDIGHGGTLPVFSYGITGFVNGDLPTVVSGTPGYSTTVTTTSPAGVYPITPTLNTLTASNYTFSFTSGTVTVHPTVVDVRVRWGKSGTYSILNLSRDLPFSGITGLEVVYSDPVQVPAASALSLTPVSGTPTPTQPTSVTIGTSSDDYIWNLPSAIGVDMLTATLNDAQISSLVNGIAIGLYGTNAFNFDVLPGDYNGDRSVTSADTVLVKNAIGTTNIWADLDGAGTVDANDVAIVQKNLGNTLPPPR